MCCGTEAGSCLRLIDSCITQRKAQGPSRTCNESKEEEEEVWVCREVRDRLAAEGPHARLRAAPPARFRVSGLRRLVYRLGFQSGSDCLAAEGPHARLSRPAPGLCFMVNPLVCGL